MSSCICCCLCIRRPPKATRLRTILPYTTLCRPDAWREVAVAVAADQVLAGPAHAGGPVDELGDEVPVAVGEVASAQHGVGRQVGIGALLLDPAEHVERGATHGDTRITHRRSRPEPVADGPAGAVRPRPGGHAGLAGWLDLEHLDRVGARPEEHTS